MVGAVVVAGGRIVGEGYHRQAGGPHAEIEAIRQAGSRCRGATLYVNLEPCCHTGRTGPCAPAIVESGICRVVAAAKDANPAVAGRGLRFLKRHGVAVEWGALEAEELRLNERFRLWATERRPFVLAKVAATLDGRIADFSGNSKWISGARSRALSMRWREEFDAILVGAATAVRDGSRLTRRLGLNRTTPQRRIVLDGRFRIPEEAPILSAPAGVEVWIGSARGTAKARRLEARGIAVRRFPTAGGGVDLRRALRALGRENVTGLIVEGGASTLTAFHEAHLIDRWAIFTSPRLLGGKEAPAILEGRGRPLSRSIPLRDVEWKRVGGDILVTGRV